MQIEPLASNAERSCWTRYEHAERSAFYIESGPSGDLLPPRTLEMCGRTMAIMAGPLDGAAIRYGTVLYKDRWLGISTSVRVQQFCTSSVAASGWRLAVSLHHLSLHQLFLLEKCRKAHTQFLLSVTKARGTSASDPSVRLRRPGHG